MSPAEGDRDPQRILIVDDEPAVREALQRSLAFEGYATEVAVDGADALEKATAYKPDLLVLDIQMPRMDGLTLVRRIREVPAWARLPVIVVSQYGRRDDLQKAASAGADRYIVKSSFEPRQLVDMVAELVA